MKPKFDFIDSEIKHIRKQNLYRTLREGTINGAYITINNKKLLNLCSNDYLGIPKTPISTIQTQSSSRSVSGNDSLFNDLEKKLAKHKSQEDCLVFPTGYMANLGAISTLIQKDDLVLSDELNHASIIESCKLARCKVSIYKHNDAKDLSNKIKQKSKRKFVITEGVFSMDGDIAKLKEISEIADKHQAITILDDAHGDFTLGSDGKGTANKLKVSKKIDLYISSLSKGLGSFGGYIASRKNVVDLCINKSKSFIYTSALPSFVIKHSLKRFESNREVKQKKLQQNVKQLSTGLQKIGYNITSPTHIIPIIIGNEKTTMDFGRYIFENGIFAQPIRYPTVSRNSARLRISVTAWLSKNQINDAIDVFEKAGKKFKIL